VNEEKKKVAVFSRSVQKRKEENRSVQRQLAENKKPSALAPLR